MKKRMLLVLEVLGAVLLLAAGLLGAPVVPLGVVPERLAVAS